MKHFNAVVLALVCASGLFAQTLKIGTTEGTACFAPAIVKVLKEGGIDAEVSILQQEQVFKDLEAGTLDGAYFLTDPAFASMQGVIKVPVKLYNVDFVAVALDPNVKISRTTDLRKYSVGMVQGNAAQETLTKGMKPIATWSEATQFKMLAEGRFNVALAARPIVENLAKAGGIDTYYIQEPALMTTPAYFALSANKASLQSRITALLRTWIDSGKWVEELTSLAQE
jgi:ABC-type amino acid transport substrate-binding protein